MSDHGEIGYLPDQSAAESCYTAMAQSHLAILIIGKRYSKVSANSFSVTENEYRTAAQRKIPIVTLVDREVMAFKRVYEANRLNDKNLQFPGMDDPVRTFDFVETVSRSPSNNGVLEYASAPEARRAVKQQLALLFGDLLAKRYDPVRAEVKDVLAEIKTLRQEIGKKRSVVSRHYQVVLRFLIADQQKWIRDLLEKILKQDLDLVVRALQKGLSWEGLMQGLKIPFEVSDNPEFFDRNLAKANSVRCWGSSIPNYSPQINSDLICLFVVTKDGKLVVNGHMHADLNAFIALVQSELQKADDKSH